jgi:hypothetical protein
MVVGFFVVVGCQGIKFVCEVITVLLQAPIKRSDKRMARDKHHPMR